MRQKYSSKCVSQKKKSKTHVYIDKSEIDVTMRFGCQTVSVLSKFWTNLVEPRKIFHHLNLREEKSCGRIWKLKVLEDE